MKQETEDRLASMVQEGLEFYGAGEFSRAFLIWTEVLEIDPNNEEARDYVRDADRRAKPRDGALEGARRTLVDEARSLLRAEGPDAALELLKSVGKGGRLDCEAMIELLRASMYASYAARLGDLSQIPRIVGGSESDLFNRNLPASAGFLLSMIDGETCLGDLVSVSGMDRFEATRSLCRMFDAGIVEWVR